MQNTKIWQRLSTFLSNLSSPSQGAACKSAFPILDQLEETGKKAQVSCLAHDTACSAHLNVSHHKHNAICALYLHLYVDIGHRYTYIFMSAGICIYSVCLCNCLTFLYSKCFFSSSLFLSASVFRSWSSIRGTQLSHGKDWSSTHERQSASWSHTHIHHIFI